MSELNLVGTTLGRFEVINELGRGGMAVVYKARQTDLDRIVALKILPPGLTHDASYVARFRQEARSAARLEHPHIMPIYEVGEAGGLHYIAMKFIQGRTLKDLVEEEGALSVSRAAQILAQVGESLDYAHKQGVIHRDVKPSNIMITEEGWVYLTDFGLARGASSGSTAGLTMAGTVMGTPEYMSPEQAQGLPNVGPPTDIYALGVVLYELITGTFPFQADTPMGMLAARLLQAPTPPRDVRGDLPPPVEDVVMRALARKPEARFPSAAAMVAALKQAAGLSEAQAQRPLTPLGGVPAVGATLVAGAHSPPAGTPRPAEPQRANPLPPLPPLPAAPAGYGQPAPQATPPYVQPAAPVGPAQAARPAAAPAAAWQSNLPTQAPGQAAPPPAYPSGPAYSGAPPAPARPSRAGLYIAIGVVVTLVLVGIVGGLALLGRGDDVAVRPTPETPATTPATAGPISVDGSPVAALVREGDPQLASSDSLAAAIASAEATLAEDARDLGALSRITLAHYLQADWPATEARAAELIAAAGDDSTAEALGRALLADAMLSQGDTASGRGEAEQAVAADRELALALAVRSNALAAEATATGDAAIMDAALQDLDAAVDAMADESTLLQALTHNVLAYTFSEEYFLSDNDDYREQSEGAYDAAQELAPGLAIVHANRGFMLNADSRFAEARDSFEEALEVDPRFVMAQAGIGWSYYQEGDTAEAEEALNAALGIDERYYLTHYALGRLRFDEQEYSEAAALFRAAAERNGRNADAVAYLGEALLFQGFTTRVAATKAELYERSEEAYRAALAIDERHAFALAGLGWILQYQDEYPESVSVFEQAIALDDQNYENFSGMGWSLLYQDKFAEAEASFRRADELNPESVDILDGLGDAIAGQGRADEARAVYEQALAIDPDSQRVKESLEALGG